MDNLGQLDLVVLLLAAAVCMVAVFRYLKLSPVLGYLVAGLAIGPYGLGLIDFNEIPQHLSEFGVIFLLFAIGLEMTLERLVSIRKIVFGFGLLQVVFTSLVFMAIGLLLNYNFTEYLIIAGGLAMSSTAIVLQVLLESGKQATQVGRLSLATLLMQDFAVVPLLIMVPLLSGEPSTLLTTVTLGMVKALAVLTLILVVGRFVLRYVFRIIWSTTNEELFVATTLLVALGSALVTEHMGLSLALGAFMAGMLVAETEYQTQVEADITPFKGLFLGLFFMTMGMTLDWHYLVANSHMIGIWLLVILAVKSGVIFGLCRLFRFPIGVSIHTALLLSQGGEFAFVLFGIAAQDKVAVLAPQKAELLMMVVTASMAITPLLAAIGAWLAKRFERGNLVEAERSHRPIDINDLRNHVIIIGYGQAGKMVARVMSEIIIPYVVIDTDMQLIEEARNAGIPIYHGDATKRSTLEHLRISQAQAVVISVHNDVAIQKTIHAVRRRYPDLPVIARAKEWFEEMNVQSDSTMLIPESFEMGLQLADSVLRYRGFGSAEIIRMKKIFRANHYAKTKELLQQ